MYKEYWQLVAKTLIETLLLNDNMWYIPNNSDSGNHTWYSDNMNSIPSFLEEKSDSICHFTFGTMEFFE